MNDSVVGEGFLMTAEGMAITCFGALKPTSDATIVVRGGLEGVEDEDDGADNVIGPGNEEPFLMEDEDPAFDV